MTKLANIRTQIFARFSSLQTAFENYMGFFLVCHDIDLSHRNSKQMKLIKWFSVYSHDVR